MAGLPVLEELRGREGCSCTDLQAGAGAYVDLLLLVLAEMRWC